MTNKEYIATLKGKKLREQCIRQKDIKQDILNDRYEVVGEFKSFDYILPNKEVYSMYDAALTDWLKWLEEERLEE
jgi:hypothetical protein